MEYNPCVRQEHPGDGDSQVERIEIVFGISVWLSPQDQRDLYDIVRRIAERGCNQPAGGIHWLFSYGAKASMSQADQRFLGLPVDSDSPEDGEPEFDDSVLQFETTHREKQEGE